VRVSAGRRRVDSGAVATHARHIVVSIGVGLLRHPAGAAVSANDLRAQFEHLETLESRAAIGPFAAVNSSMPSGSSSARTIGVAEVGGHPGRAYAKWAVWILVVTLVFIRPLMALAAHASTSELYSYIPLVPFVSAWLVWSRREAFTAGTRPAPAAGAAMCLVAAAALALDVSVRGRLSLNDHLALTTAAYVALVLAGGFLFLGWLWMTAAAFPAVFLFFMAPLPDALVRVIENGSVLGSAEVSALLFRLTGTPLVREGTVFALPGIVIEVARECSGINSSWVLFVVGLVASNMFLQATWARVVLVAFITPLAIVRNSVRILTIGLLCVHIGPHMIDSYIHRSGGPIFFVLSLIPLFLLLLWLRRLER
jgi:exosortase C (VPDSG-CTERM-specific)